MTSAPPGDGRIAVRSVDLTRPLEGLADVSEYETVRVFVTAGGALLGSADIDTHHHRVTAARLREAIVDAVAGPLLERMLIRHLVPDEGPGLGPDVSTSIVVVTSDRPNDLRACLRGVVGQASRRRVEVVVVDNHPSSKRTPPVLAEFPGVVLVNEERRGRACARNTGLLASTGDLVVTIDDDVTMGPDWLETLLSPFVDPDVMAVTGAVLPLALETRAQRLLDARRGTGRLARRREVDGEWFAQFVSAVPTWELGGTTNAAFRAAIFRNHAVGLMDEALGAGTPTGSGEDLYLFYKVLAAGFRLVHEPAAHVWHHDPSRMEDARRVVYREGKGHVAYHLTTLMRHGDRRALVRLLLKLPWSHLRRAGTRLRGRADDPLSLILAEVAGNLAGPCSLWRSRRRVNLERRAALARVRG